MAENKNKQYWILLGSAFGAAVATYLAQQTKSSDPIYYSLIAAGGALAFGITLIITVPD